MKVRYTKKIEFDVDQFGAMERRFGNPKVSIELDDNESNDMQIVSAIANFCKSFYMDDAKATLKRFPNKD